MIQRVQTIFLAIAAIAAFSIIFLPIWAKGVEASQSEILLDARAMKYMVGTEMQMETNTIAISVLAVLSSIVALGSLFSYKDRMKQMKLNLLNALILAGVVGSMVYYLYQGSQIFSPEIQGSFDAGFFMPLVALFCNSMANRFIRKDEKLVKSVDRLR